MAEGEAKAGKGAANSSPVIILSSGESDDVMDMDIDSNDEGLPDVFHSHASSRTDKHPVNKPASSSTTGMFKDKWHIFEKADKVCKGSKEIATCLLSPPVHKVNDSVPVGCSEEYSFLVDTSKLTYAYDLLCDETGKYKRPSYSKCDVFVDNNNNVFCGKGAIEGNRKLTLLRKYYPHKDTKGFQRIVYELQCNNVRAYPVVIIGYKWLGEKSELCLTPHGNAKDSHQPFIRSKREMTSRLKEMPSTSAQSKVNDMFDKGGGLQDITSFSGVPRNRKQVYNHCKPKGSRVSNFTKLMEMGVTGEFVKGFEINRSSNKGPMPRAILYTDAQAADVRKYCCRGKSILHFDCTFDCGSMYVTIGSYRNPKFLNKSNGKEVLMPGPIMLHSNRDTESYAYFGNHISTAVGKETVQFFGTDREAALVKGLQMTPSFQKSQHLRCMLHSRKNTESKLTEFGIKYNSERILRSIYGQQIGETRYEGLVDSNSKAQYEEQLAHWEPLWNQMEKEDTGKEEAKFSVWFRKNKSKEIKENMLKSVRQEAGLGTPPRQYTTNDAEAMNSMVSKWISGKQTWDNLTDKLQSFVAAKYKELELAIIGLGDIKLADLSRQMTTVQWMNMTKREKSDTLAEFSIPGHSHNTEDSPSLPGTGCLPHSLTIQPEETGIGGYTLSELTEVWRRAEEILSVDNSVVPFPKAAKQWICFDGKEHFKVVLKGSFECSSTCRSYLFHQRLFCEHTLAVAENASQLADHVCKINTKKHASSVNVVLQSQCRHSGQKATKRIGTNNATGMDVKKVVPMPSTHQPFTVARKIGLISTCYGCKKKFAQSMNEPPNDIVLRKLDFREWYDKQSGEKRTSGSLVPTYYHLSLNCIRKTYPYTQADQILVYSEIEANLTEAHKNTLRAFGVKF